MKQIPSIKLLYVLFLIGTISCEKPCDLSILSCSVDNRIEATGVDTSDFVFSWKILSEQRNAKQIAYRIVLADDKDFGDENIIWDSDRIGSQQSILVKYNGKALEPGRKYFWKVKVWDNFDNESEWTMPGSFITALLKPDNWSNAKWIGFEELPDTGRLVEGVTGYGNLSKNKVEKRAVVPMFRKSFLLEDEIESATLFISGLGQYEASLNGEKIGADFLTPGWTHYDKTILYNTYDVTELIEAGENALGVIVGNGFYYNNRERYRKLIIAYGYPKLICKLQIKLKNGKEQTLVSNANWQTKPSPITYAGIYGGEDYDATLEEPGWNEAGFNTESWQSALEVKAPTGNLKPDRNHPIKVMQTFEADSVIRLNDSVWVYDFGQNASGIVSLKVKGEKGQKVQLRPGEVLKEDGFVNQRGSGSPYYFNYTLKGDGDESWQPRFSYYGFRYVQVTGAQPYGSETECEWPEIIALKALHTRNSTPQVGTFECSNSLFNKAFSLINWGIKSNLQNVMTDCPTREKLGWLEQTHLVGPSIHYNFDMYNLYSKLIDDMEDAQVTNGLVPNIIPEYINFEYYDAAFRDSPEWGSASILQPWLVYKWYGDVSKIEQAWPMMQRYFAYLESKSENHLLSHGLGDWYDVGPETPGYAQLTPVKLVASAMYYYDAVLMAKIAEVLGESDRANYYSTLAEKIKTSFNNDFYNEETKTYSTGSQTAMAMPLSMGLVPEKDKQLVLSRLVETIENDNKRITAGDVGFHFLVDALTKYGESELLFEMNNRDDVPGYGYQIKKGATSLAESWQALETKSLNHLMLGHLMEWLYSGLAGISQTKTSVGYKEIKIEPQIVGDITSVKASFETPYGMIKSEWTDSDEHFILKVDIPVNSSAIVVLSTNNVAQLSENGNLISAGNFDFEELGGKVKIKVGSGNYEFAMKK